MEMISKVTQRTLLTVVSVVVDVGGNTDFKCGRRCRLSHRFPATKSIIKNGVTAAVDGLSIYRPMQSARSVWIPSSHFLLFSSRFYGSFLLPKFTVSPLRRRQ